MALEHTARTACLALAAQLAVLVWAPEARAEEACEIGRPGGPVYLLIVQSGWKVHEFAASVRGASIVRRDPTTVIFSDGRVVTADVESATRHLNELKWGRRRVEIVASFPRTRPSRRRAVG